MGMVGDEAYEKKRNVDKSGKTWTEFIWFSD